MKYIRTKDELGIDLLIKLKVETYYMQNYKKGSVDVYVKSSDEVIRDVCIHHFYPTAIKALAGGFQWAGDLELHYRDYGKTWALTKEELL